MKVLVVGGGGREHTLCWKLARSESVDKVYCAPGNAGISRDAECVPLKVEDMDGLAAFAEEKGVDLTVVGPELPLTLGLADAFAAKGLKVFGPDGFAAQLEGSKIFAKEFMREMSIPTAGFSTFDKLEDAVSHLDAVSYPTVIKADGLAAGKGVLVAKDKQEAKSFLEQVMVDRVFKDAGDRVIIEECLQGEECSILALADGKDMVVLTPSQDHKRAYDNDEGLNTGGMGAYSPVSIVDEKLVSDIRASVLEPVIEGMKKKGHPFTGVIYAGLMLTDSGPQVLEYNVRFGDPEAQVVIPLIEGDLAQICLAGAEGNISSAGWKPSSKSAICVVMASGGYPGSYEKGKPISGLDEAGGLEGVTVFHAGTAEKDGRIVTAGGRVLGVTALANGLPAARDRAYEAVSKISWDGVHYRKDIAKRDMDRIGG